MPPLEESLGGAHQRLPLLPHSITGSSGAGILRKLEERREGRWLSPASFEGNFFVPRSYPQSTQLPYSSSLLSWRLSLTRQLHSLDRCIESIDVHPSESHRYMLAGSKDGILSVYDLSNRGGTVVGTLHHDNIPKRIHKPIARSAARSVAEHDLSQVVSEQDSTYSYSSLGPLLSCSWYPEDTGAFVSAHRGGKIAVWDTNAMTPLVQMEPFGAEHRSQMAMQYSRRNNQLEDEAQASTASMSLSCMNLSQTNPQLLATGSLHSSLVKLVDLRSGATSHSLMSGKHNGLSSIQWSPTASHILATGCTTGQVRLWDIRKAGRQAWLVECFDPDVPPPDSTVSQAFYPDLRHLKQSNNGNHGRTTASSFTEHTPSSGSQRPPKKSRVTKAPNDFSTARSFARSHNTAVDALAFDPSGQYLVSHGQGQATVHIWDLRDAGQRLARRYRLLPRVKQIRMKVTQSMRDTTLWMTQESHLVAFSLNDDDASAEPILQLKGHLKSIRDFCVVREESIVTAGADGLILSWEPDILSTDYNNGGFSQRKTNGRRRKQIKRDVDEDTW